MVEALIVSQVFLWIAVIGLGVLCFALTRQIGVLYERIAPAGALSMNEVLKPGEDAPSMSLPTLTGVMQEIGGTRDGKRSQLLFFLSPDCPVCKSLLPAVKSIARAEGDWLDVILASDGSDQAHKEYVKAQGLEAFPYVSSEILGRQFGVAKLPYSVLIDEKGKIASMGLVNSREHLDSLFVAKQEGVHSIQDYLNKREPA
ncbi:redoxin family protein [Emcibacter nanhaiensis]|uniref:Redoxin domain-containing protein n=1 Tax=Emcibacter nanhaiensis TaxID=1505037 RepID=A0A501PFD1_9PROT|nr:redoxin family protein [Emcibacter nanhaiensis]TPD59123.1 redoxin domain-containing protein [Emcibacter nanhaiensis]